MYVKHGYSFHFAQKFGHTVHTSKEKTTWSFQVSSQVLAEVQRLYKQRTDYTDSYIN